MHPSRATLSLAALFAVSSLVNAVNFDCSHLRIDGYSFDLSELGGPKVLRQIEDGWPTVKNKTFTFDICKPLAKPSSRHAEQCPSGTYACLIEYAYNKEENTEIVTEVVPIAGNYEASHGRNLEAQITRLKDSASNSDSEREGVRVELHGGMKPFDAKNGIEQKAIIEFNCDASLTGLEGVEEASKSAGKEEKKERRQEDGDETGDGESGKSSLEFISYKEEGEKTEVLRLGWKTKYACERDVDTGTGSKSAHWGFFTWLIIILFLGVASYLIFGSWLNYNRYGARGWDLLPHGDTIRDIPYIAKDLGRNLVSKVQGGGSRGGYSAV